MRCLAYLLPLAALAACTSRPQPVPAPVAAVAAPAAVSPFAGIGTLRVPARLADGGYATPNRLVASPAGALWHLRAGLNVAALSCNGPDATAIVAGYNGLLAAHRAEFAAAYRTFGSEYGSIDRFDQAMTGLYNYFALGPARDGLCRAALAVLTATATVPAGELAPLAPDALARLDAPYVAVFAAQDAWLAARAPATTLAALSPRLEADRAVLVLP